MPRSQTPVVSCTRALSPPGLLPSGHWKPSAVPRYSLRRILWTTTRHISGRHHAAYILVPSSFVRPLLGVHVDFTTDLLARLLSGGICTSPVRTHWATTTISWDRSQFQGFGFTLARPVPGSAGDTQGSQVGALHLDSSRIVVLHVTRSTVPRSTPTSTYWITSSAWKRSAGGIVTPRAFAVLRLMTNSNFTGRSTGRSAGFVPLRILST